MNEPNILKQPQRVAKELQASVLAQARFTAPEADANAEAEADESEETELAPKRFATRAAPRSFVLVDEDVEYCAEVMDEESERVWEVAVWPSPPASDLPKTGRSYCLVIGSKNQAREVLESMGVAVAGAKANHPSARGGEQPGYVGRQTANKVGRNQQKQG